MGRMNVAVYSFRFYLLLLVCIVMSVFLSPHLPVEREQEKMKVVH